MTNMKKSLSVVLSLVIMVSSLVCSVVAAQGANFKTVEGTLNYSYAAQVLTLLNQERRNNGLSDLTMTSDLTDGAMLRAAETAVSFSHTRPNGEQCFTAFNWTRTAGENIAYGQRSPQEVMQGWMNSSGHRANILNPSFTTVGIGCFAYNGRLYWAQAFSGGSGKVSIPSGQKAVTVEVSLTAGVNSVMHFAGSTTTVTTTLPTETTTKPVPPTTKAQPSTTKPVPSTTKAQPSTTKPAEATTKTQPSATTSAPATTKAATTTTRPQQTVTTKRAANVTVKRYYIPVKKQVIVRISRYVLQRMIQ